MPHCRSCSSGKLVPVLDLGTTPLADALVPADRLGAEEPRFPLEVVFCEDCSLVQILETVPPEQLFCEDYPYYSSFSDALLRHSKANVDELLAARDPGPDGLVVELASNDGYLLQYYAQAGVPVLGIDPAEGPARAAVDKGVPTLNTFFTLELARRLAAEGRRADVVHGNNVLAHVADTNGFVEGIATLLKDDGLAVIEAPYLRDLVEHCEFDTIYHEHLCYFSVTALDKLFRRHGLFLNDVRRIPIHGGSLRMFVGRTEAPLDGVLTLLREERELGMDRRDYYRDFADRVRGVREGLRRLLGELKAGGARIAAYGAAAKGATMLNYTGIGTETLDFVVDRNVHKQGKYMPGVRVPIDAPERLLAEQPDYCLILPWNFKDEIQEQQAEYVARGGRFIVPIPTPRVLEPQTA
ncbi:MAG: class I SAM-dependent methyltransferase [Planctomycetota bacterium]